jgi:hypothetical protein
MLHGIFPKRLFPGVKEGSTSEHGLKERRCCADRQIKGLAVPIDLPEAGGAQDNCLTSQASPRSHLVEIFMIGEAGLAV